jgi:hypothetical protein
VRIGPTAWPFTGFIHTYIHTDRQLDKYILDKSHFKPFLSYLPCIVCREYFSINTNVKKCALYSIKYGNSSRLLTVLLMILVYISRNHDHQFGARIRCWIFNTSFPS